MPVPCQLCPATNATVHLTELGADGVRTELHLCRACIARLEVALDAPPPLASLLAQATTAVAGDETDDAIAVPAPEPGEGACPQCGLEFTAYVQSNLFGCAECYQAFAVQVTELVRRYHGATAHVGRLPAAGIEASPGARREAARAALTKALDDAVAREQFERAAALRDQLRELERDRP